MRHVVRLPRDVCLRRRRFSVAALLDDVVFASLRRRRHQLLDIEDSWNDIMGTAVFQRERRSMKKYMTICRSEAGQRMYVP